MMPPTLWAIFKEIWGCQRCSPFRSRRSLLLFLFSTRSLVLLASGGLGLFFGGVIADRCFPMAVALYARDGVTVPADRELALQVHKEVTRGDLLVGLDELIRKSKYRLPAEAIDRLICIQGLAAGLAHKLFSGEVAMGLAISLANAVTKDLPGIVSNTRSTGSRSCCPGASTLSRPLPTLADISTVVLLKPAPAHRPICSNRAASSPGANPRSGARS